MSADFKKRLIDDWFRFAQEDLEAAAELFSRGYYHHQTCLLSQQSAEKHLKAFLLSQGWKLLKTHELSMLVAECCTYDCSFEVLFPSGEFLNKYIVSARYPGDQPFESTTAADAEKALEAAHTIKIFVNAKRF